MVLIKILYGVNQNSLQIFAMETEKNEWNAFEDESYRKIGGYQGCAGWIRGSGSETRFRADGCGSDEIVHDASSGWCFAGGESLRVSG